MESLSLIVEKIKNSDFFGILTHKYPDGDAIGSSFALCRTLQKMGKHAKVLLGDEIPEKFEFLSDSIVKEDFEPENYISVDLSDIKLLPESLAVYADRIGVCIDHHKSNMGYAEITFVNPQAAANCEIVFELIKLLDANLIDEKTAQCLYIGISTDTGGFMYSNTSSRSHYIVSELMKKNISADKINEKMFILKTFKKFRTENIIYNNLKLCFSGKVAITYITIPEMQREGISENELDGIASVPIKIENVEIGITIREKSNGICKVSVRTRNDIDASSLCAQFGGGGHARAAGFEISGNAKNAISKIIDKISEYTGWKE